MKNTNKHSAKSLACTTPLVSLLHLVLLFLWVFSGSGCSSIKLDHRSRTLIEARHPHPVPQKNYIRQSGPIYPTYEEVQSLLHNPTPEGALSEKLESLWTTPIVDNSAYFRGTVPTVASNQWMGKFVRFAEWNIEKSLEMPRVLHAMHSEEAYKEMINTNKVAPGSVAYERMMRQRARLAACDILVAVEMDIGVPRSGYRNAAEDLAASLGMNYAFGTQYVEIDPVQVDLAQTPDKQAQYKGLFGSAILSRYPIKKAELEPLSHQPYDWYKGEIADFGPLEGGRRLGSKLLFNNPIYRELKVGGRNFFRIDLEVPGLPENTLTVIVVHLEIKCEPAHRRKQMQEILARIKDIRNPVVMAGDFNSAPADISNTSALKLIRKKVSDPTTYLSALITMDKTYGSWIERGRVLFTGSKNFDNPLARNIPVLFPNHVRPMFDDIMDFRFSDGGSFDVRGTQDRSINGSTDVLANANQRATKGLVTTFSVRRPIGFIGRYRLDWIFVKRPADADSEDSDDFVFAPHYGETLKAFNENMTLPLSDHNPCLVDLPLSDPRLLKGEASPHESQISCCGRG